MKNVKSLQQFRAVLNTCKYWGDTWALSTLERALNTKFILLSEEKYFDEDTDNVLQCGQLNDSILEEISGAPFTVTNIGISTWLLSGSVLKIDKFPENSPIKSKVE